MVFAVPLLRFLLGYLSILVHELGHTVAGWAFGYPSIPSFDFRYGGGVTLLQERSTVLLLILYALFAWCVLAWRDVPARRNLALVVVALYSLAAFTSLHQLIVAAMGHAMELAIAAIFLYRALSGAAVASPAERPLYAMCGVFLAGGNLALAWNLMTDIDRRAAYSMAKGGACRMDLDVIAGEHLHVGVPAVAFLLLLATLATPLVAYLAYRQVDSGTHSSSG
ncbi:MAG: hypothetical protein AAGC60_06235 [Acidobacteriota bacterium]